VAIPKEDPAVHTSGLLVDPLSPEDLLLSCAVGRFFRVSLKDGTAGTMDMLIGSKRSDARAPVNGPVARVRLNTPNGLAVAPPELWTESDALVLMLCDSSHHRICLIRAPF
jgi:hypothetical protein